MHPHHNISKWKVTIQPQFFSFCPLLAWISYELTSHHNITKWKITSYSNLGFFFLFPFVSLDIIWTDSSSQYHEMKSYELFKPRSFPFFPPECHWVANIFLIRELSSEYRFNLWIEKNITKKNNTTHQFVTISRSIISNMSQIQCIEFWISFSFVNWVASIVLVRDLLVNHIQPECHSKTNPWTMEIQAP